MYLATKFLKMKKAFVITTITCIYICFSFLHSCEKENNASPVSLRDRQEVYEENILEIEEYLQTNYLTIDANNNVTIELIPEGGTQTSIWDAYKIDNFNDTGVESVPYKEVKNDSRKTLYTDGVGDDIVNYKLYFIKINEGNGVTPTNLDSTYVAYKGWNLDNEVFDQNNVGRWFTYPEPNMSSISGFRQILSEIKTEGSSFLESNGTVTHEDYGHLVVFIPSGLAYFNSSINGTTSAYSPIAFEIKLFNRKERDHDGDRVLSNFEDLNYDNNFFNDDTDGDKTPDFLDVDDDGDSYLTKYEIRYKDVDGNYIYNIDGNHVYYPFNGAAIDDPSTTEIDETRGIPDCSDPIDYNSPTRLRKHLDPSCH